MDPLFRPEVYQSANTSGYGNTSIYQPMSIRVMTVGAICITCIFIVFFCMGNYTSKATVNGYLEPTTGLMSIWAPHPGILKAVYIEEGQTVKQGDPLFVIVSEHASLQSLDTNKTILDQLNKQKLNFHNAILNEQELEKVELIKSTSNQKKLHSQLMQSNDELTIAKNKVTSQKAILSSYKKLQKNNFISDLETEQATHKLLELQSQVEGIKKRRIILTDEISLILNDIHLKEILSRKEQNSIQQRIIIIERQITDQQQKQATVILAPSDGIVTTLPIYKNQMITNGQQLTALVPMNTQLKATLAVPSKSSGFLKLNQKVNIRYSAFPYQKFGYQIGSVKEIDQSLTIPNNQRLPIKVTEPVYLISVILQSQSVFAYGKSYSLKAGMALEADIELEKRSIIEWLLGPIISFTKEATR